MDYKNYLLNELEICKNSIAEQEGFEHFSNYKIVVAEERAIDYQGERNSLIFIMKKITGTYVLNSVKTQPVQIICYSEFNTIEDAYRLLELFTKTHHQYQFTENDNIIKVDFETPVSLRAFVEQSSGYKASLYCFGSFTECIGVADIKNLKWYNEELDDWEDIDYISASLSYASVINTTKVSGEKLSTSDEQEASLTLTLTLMNTANEFCKTINGIILGKLSGNTKIRVKFDLNGWVDNYYEMTVQMSPLSTDRVSAPGLNVTLIL